MTQWYYRDLQSKKIGPLSTEEFKGCIAEGAILPATRVWRSGLIDWTTYEALLAHDANCGVATGPQSCNAPHSSSRSLASLPGTSALHHRDDDGGAATPASTPPQCAAPQFEPCHGCGEELPSHLFAEFESRRLCGGCVGKAKASAVREVLREAKGPDANWLIKHLALLVLAAGLIVAVRIGFMELGGAAATATKSLPVPENLAPSTQR
jgi:hypothetical protein